MARIIIHAGEEPCDPFYEMASRKRRTPDEAVGGGGAGAVPPARSFLRLRKQRSPHALQDSRTGMKIYEHEIEAAAEHARFTLFTCSGVFCWRNEWFDRMLSVYYAEHDEWIKGALKTFDARNHARVSRDWMPWWPDDAWNEGAMTFLYHATRLYKAAALGASDAAGPMMTRTDSGVPGAIGTIVPPEDEPMDAERADIVGRLWVTSESDEARVQRIWMHKETDERIRMRAWSAMNVSIFKMLLCVRPNDTMSLADWKFALDISELAEKIVKKEVPNVEPRAESVFPGDPTFRPPTEYDPSYDYSRYPTKHRNERNRLTMRIHHHAGVNSVLFVVDLAGLAITDEVKKHPWKALREWINLPLGNDVRNEVLCWLNAEVDVHFYIRADEDLLAYIIDTRVTDLAECFYRILCNALRLRVDRKFFRFSEKEYDRADASKYDRIFSNIPGGAGTDSDPRTFTMTLTEIAKFPWSIDTVHAAYTDAIYHNFLEMEARDEPKVAKDFSIRNPELHDDQYRSIVDNMTENNREAPLTNSDAVLHLSVNILDRYISRVDIGEITKGTVEPMVTVCLLLAHKFISTTDGYHQMDAFKKKFASTVRRRARPV